MNVGGPLADFGASITGGAVEAPAFAYDALPYRSLPYEQTQPARMAANAILFGATPPAIETARVLELGCASGGNLIPLAVRFPDSTFIGVDLSQRQIHQGHQQIQLLELSNIKLLHGDLAIIDLGDQRFDYIICHGVFSWVDHGTQEAIFRICSEQLVDNGIAHISYNVLPGWHLRNIVRDICRHHASEDLLPTERVTRARWILDQVSRVSPEASNFGRVLRNEAGILSKLPDSYILSEFLAIDNSPIQFTDFSNRAAAHDLTFLCEAEIAQSIPESLGPDQATMLRTIAGPSGTALEQYMDFFTGRPFRRSLLVKRDFAVSLKRGLTPDRLVSLHFSSSLSADAQASGEGNWVFKDDRFVVTTNDPVLAGLFTALADASPETMTIAQIETAIATKSSAATARVALLEGAIRDAAFNAITSGRITASLVPLMVGRADADRPTAWRLARLQAASEQAWGSGLHHRAVALSPTTRLLLHLLDGSRDREKLRNDLVDHLRRGVSNVELLEPGEGDLSKLDQIDDGIIGRALLFLQRHALLEPVH